MKDSGRGKSRGCWWGQVHFAEGSIVPGRAGALVAKVFLKAAAPVLARIAGAPPEVDLAEFAFDPLQTGTFEGGVGHGNAGPPSQALHLITASQVVLAVDPIVPFSAFAAPVEGAWFNVASPPVRTGVVVAGTEVVLTKGPVGKFGAEAEVAAQLVLAGGVAGAIVGKAFVNLSLAETAFIEGAGAVAFERPDGVPAQAPVQAGVFQAFVNVDLANASLEPGAFAVAVVRPDGVQTNPAVQARVSQALVDVGLAEAVVIACAGTVADERPVNVGAHPVVLAWG